MFCQNCDEKNNDSNKFCAEYGNAINNINVVPKKKVSQIILVIAVLKEKLKYFRYVVAMDTEWAWS